MRGTCVLLLLLLTPLASAAGVDVRDVRVPDRTMAGVAFGASVTVENLDDAPRVVHLLAALYRSAEGQGPCGPATDPRFETFTPLVQARLDLPARAVVAYPPPGETWLQMYQVEHVEAQPRDEEWCVFAAEDRGQQIEYLDVEAVPLSVRGANARPVATFEWSPGSPIEAVDVTFDAQATDADGDPVTFTWDFGHANASGRAVASGPRVTHFFYPAGQYTVTLRASDGLQEGVVLENIRVAPEARSKDEDAGTNETPLPLVLTLAAALLALLRRSRP